jgi:beta-aspartyl-peptidase (threonine type)
MRPSIIVHGGAWDIPTEVHEAHKHGCRTAAETGYAILASGGSSLDAVEAAVRSMEEDATFDAGKGSHLNREGEVELDAIIMEGAELRFGAVAAVQHVLHPVTLARLVMERTEHCMLVGEGALRFARSVGMESVPVHDLLTEWERERWEQIRGRKRFEQRDVFAGSAAPPQCNGTVGAVAIDGNGTVSAATSTGGTPNKMVGRVGDSPLVGCGAYADNSSAGVSATGLGESLMKVVMARHVCDLVEKGAGAQRAADESVSYLEQKVRGLGGVIVMDRGGESAFSHNTPHMAVASVDGKGKMRVRI